MDFPAQRERDLTLPHFCIPRRPPQDWMMPTHICVGGLSSESNADLFWKQPTETFRNDVLPSIWESFSPIKLTHNITHHIQ